MKWFSIHQSPENIENGNSILCEWYLVSIFRILDHLEQFEVRTKMVLLKRIHELCRVFGITDKTAFKTFTPFLMRQLVH